MFEESNGLIEEFRIYFTYCSKFQQSNKLYERMKGTNQAFKEFMHDLRVRNVLKGLDLQDLLVKPVQRLPKYVLLFRDLVKHTPSSHPDYRNILQCLEQFKEINDANNATMDRQLGGYKMFELQRVFGN